jgi:hypothetical protein
MKVHLVIFMIVVSMQEQAMSATTKGGHAACLKKEWYDNMVSFVVAKDKASFQTYVDSKKCIILKKGLHVTVTESPGMFGGTAGFIFQGVNFWTARGALEYGR